VCVKELDRGIEILLKEKNRDKSHDIFIKVDLIENEADSLRREILADISKGELHPSIRTDLSHLIKRLDDVANCATGVARRINTIPMTFWEQSSPETLYLISEMMKVTVECGDYLDKIVIDLLGDRKNVEEYNNQINKLEHDVDVLNIRLRESLQATKYDINAFTVFTVGNTMDIIEAISDAMEVAADYMMLLLRSANVL
jgi:predicted phosphate transport protein (TIGR00153 family)